jgi:beta-lactamase superfamily II metal-dependent hydrolase
MDKSEFLKITFHNVGQGDSISLESENFFAIIDCNNLEKKNPIISYIEASKIKFINFILLSHPHYDHFSGLLSLLNYLDEKEIIVSNFFFTGRFSRNYIENSILGNEPRELLAKIFKKAQDMKNAGKIGYISPVYADGRSIIGTSFFQIVPLAPENNEYLKLEKAHYSIDVLNKSCNLPNANNLSSVLMIESSSFYILLTSDAPKTFFEKNLKNLKISDKIAQLIQVPHHGSRSNFYVNFWDKLKRSSICFAPISAGIGYDHPHLEVLNSLNNLDYTIDQTNINKLPEKIVEKSKCLDNFSEKIEVITEVEKPGQNLIYTFNKLGAIRMSEGMGKIHH